MRKLHIALIAAAAAVSSAFPAPAYAKAWLPEDAVHEVRDAKSGFVHPGIGFTRDDLLMIAKNVRDGVEPWKSSYASLVKHDHRFSTKPRVFTRRGEGLTAIDSPDFDNRCAWDSQSAMCQAVLYIVDGDERHRKYAMDVVRWFYRNIKSGRPHWDSQFRWPNAERWYLMACELLRYSGPTSGPLAWTDEDTAGVDAFIRCGEGLWWGRGTFLNQLQFTLGGPLARAIWRNDRAKYDAMVEIVTCNAQGPKGEGNGSIKEMCRLVTENEVTGEKVKPHVQYSEMGRDIGHPFPGAGALADNLAIIRSQGTRVDPADGTVSRKKNAVDPIEYLDHRFLRGVNQICKYNLGFDIDWTPIYVNRKKNDVWSRPANWGGGRGRIVDLMDILHSHYRWKRGVDMSKSEDTRYFRYANRLRGPNLFYQFLWTPREAAGKWKDERIDPGKDGVNRFAEFILPRESGVSVMREAKNGPAFVRAESGRLMFPMFLHNRYPLPGPGEYVLRYCTKSDGALGIINPEDYKTEFEDEATCTKRKYVEKIALPSTGGNWKELVITLENPPKRNLVKLDFRTRGGPIDVEWLRIP